MYRHWAKQQPRSKHPVMTAAVANRVYTVDRHIFVGPDGTCWVKSSQDAQPVRLKGHLRGLVPSALRQERETRTVEHCPAVLLGDRPPLKHGNTRNVGVQKWQRHPTRSLSTVSTRRTSKYNYRTAWPPGLLSFSTGLMYRISL
jgi:hypothetical protein